MDPRENKQEPNGYPSDCSFFIASGLAWVDEKPIKLASQTLKTPLPHPAGGEAKQQA